MSDYSTLKPLYGNPNVAIRFCGWRVPSALKAGVLEREFAFRDEIGLQYCGTAQIDEGATCYWEESLAKFGLRAEIL